MSLKKFFGNKNRILLASLALFVIAGISTGVAYTVSAQGRNATTLAAVKTIEICDTGTYDEGGNLLWRYSGDIAVWNEGVVDTQNLRIVDCIQNKTGAGQFTDKYCVDIVGGTAPAAVIPKGTSMLTATTFKYSIVRPALAGDIRNIAKITITNHSGSIGTPKGPEPKATWTKGAPQPCATECVGCTYSQGYWGNKPDVVWPAPYDRNAPFFLSGLTWQQVLDEPNAGGNGYFILAKQYIAMVLNKANGSCVLPGVQEIMDLATAWLTVNTQGTPKIGNGPGSIPATGCYVGGSCGTQKDWGGILDDYIQGTYPGSPGHCGE